jgi:hypothetical protein
MGDEVTTSTSDMKANHPKPWKHNGISMLTSWIAERGKCRNPSLEMQPRRRWK